MPQRNAQNQPSREPMNRASRRQQQRAEAHQQESWSDKRGSRSTGDEGEDDHRLVRGDPYGNTRQDAYDGDRAGSGGYGRGDYGDRDQRDGGYGGGRGSDRYDHFGDRGDYEGASASDREQWGDQGDGWRGNDRGGSNRGRYDVERTERDRDRGGHLGDTEWDSQDAGSSDSAMRQRDDGYGGRQRNGGGRRGDLRQQGFGSRGRQDHDEAYGGSHGGAFDGTSRDGGDAWDRGRGGMSGGHDGAQGARWGRQGPHAGRGPKGYRRSDERIREDVNEMLTQHPEIDASEIEVRVQDGDVTLGGTVSDRRTKRLAEDVAEACSGVKDVQNQLRVGAGQQTGASPEDASPSMAKSAGGETNGRSGNATGGNDGRGTRKTAKQSESGSGRQHSAGSR